MTTNPIIPKIAYIALEYTLSVDKFISMWCELEDVDWPTQKDYDDWCLDSAKSYFYNMQGEIEDSIRLMEDN